MIENTATYDFLIENENHSRIALKNTIRERAQSCRGKPRPSKRVREEGDLPD